MKHYVSGTKAISLSVYEIFKQCFYSRPPFHRMKQHVQLHHVLLLLLQEKELHSIYVLQEERTEQEGESRIKAFLTVVVGIMYIYRHNRRIISRYMWI